MHFRTGLLDTVGNKIKSFYAEHMVLNRVQSIFHYRKFPGKKPFKSCWGTFWAFSLSALLLYRKHSAVALELRILIKRKNLYLFTDSNTNATFNVNTVIINTVIIDQIFSWAKNTFPVFKNNCIKNTGDHDLQGFTERFSPKYAFVESASKPYPKTPSLANKLSGSNALHYAALFRIKAVIIDEIRQRLCNTGTGT
jgi:hypothetical protein